jgi:hypothetical protein
MFFICFSNWSPSLGADDKQIIPVVTLKETLRVGANSGDFYFKYPADPIVDARGNTFVIDQEQVLLFSADGTYIRNFFKKGLGPGELTDVIGLVPEEKNIIIVNKYPHKLLWFNRQGELIKEFRISEKLGSCELLTYYGGRFYFLREKFRDTKNKAVYLDIKVKLFSTAPDETTVKEESVWFPKKYFVFNRGWIKNLHFVQIGQPDPSTAFIANYGDYDIKRLDLKKMQFIPFIQKKYNKVKIKPEWKNVLKPTRFPHKGPNGMGYKIFERPHLDDIQRIFIYRSFIWIFTSGFDEKKRLVDVDVFDLKGVFKGSLKFKMPGVINLFQMSYKPFRLNSVGFYIFTPNEEEELELVKYDLLNVPSLAKNH